ncbi:MAG: hypothetical protein ACI854_001675 [Arenicella sp.]|jgi:hypothetical protein
MKTSRAHFYIVYTRGTVGLLVGFVFSLLRWSDAEFTLVSNACDRAEKNTLKRFCDNNKRLNYLALGSTTVLSHGAALNILQDQNAYHGFGFIDSDIFAIAEFWPSGRDDQNSIVACQFIPVAASFRLSSEVQSLHQNRLGCSYFMHYDNQSISALRSDTGIHFDKYQWQSIPLDIRARLDAADVKRGKYDTARLVNALLLSSGEQVVALADTPLRHIGGVSRINLQRQRRVSPLLESLIKLIPMSKIKIRLINRALDRDQVKPLSASGASEQKKTRKRLVNHYFRALLLNLTQAPGQTIGQGLPAYPVSGCRFVDQRVAEISRELIALFQSLESDQSSVLRVSPW